VIVAGTGRGGTTWIADIVNFRNHFRVMFEPFNCREVSLVHDFSLRQYIRPDDPAPQFLEAVRRVLSGRVRGTWIDRYNRKMLSSKRLIKDIRISLFLKWVKKNFPKTCIILVLRHPCAVADSRLRAGWQPHLTSFLEQPQLMEEFLGPFESLLSNV